jgi:hypothetical protein
MTAVWEDASVEIEKLLTEDVALTAQPYSENVLHSDTAYRFTRFYHPYTCLFLKQLSRAGLDGLLNPDPDRDAESKNLHRQLTPHEKFDFQTTYQPTDWVEQPCPDEQIDFDHYSPYGSHNWELFFHIPLLIATRLMQHQRFAEARKWFHYVFDPTYAEGKPPARFWKIKPFYEEQGKEPTETLAELLDLLAGSRELEQQVQDWEQDPLQPHAIARLRIVTYMQTTVMKYLDCLIGEADMLFTMDTREAINEAAQLYLLAGEILGDRPTLLPPQATTPYTPNQMLGRDSVSITLPSFVDPLDKLTAQMPNMLPGRPPTGSDSVLLPDTVFLPQGAMSNYGTLLRFYLPPNDKLYACWDTVADRLFKIRHCMNISGQVRQLALFAPPIDPALLVRASAAGLDIASILAGLYAPLSNYRFSFMLQKALEFCGEARNLGGALLAALEKQDAEQLSLLRSRYEISLLAAMRALKQKNVEEAGASLAALFRSKEAAEFRIEYYTNLARVSSGEQTSLDKQEGSRNWQLAAEIAEMTFSVLYAFPEMEISAGKFSTHFGGLHLGSVARAVAAELTYEANKVGIMAGYERRQQEWRFQVALAQKEIRQLEKQLLAAEIRQQIAAAELANHDKQVAQAEEVEAFLKLKFSNQQLYSWMLAQLSSLYFQSYQLAYRLAKQAEKCFLHELGPADQSLSFIQATY